MAGISHGERLASLGHPVACEESRHPPVRQAFPGSSLRCQASFSVQPNETGRNDGSWRKQRKESIRQAGVAVVESQRNRLPRFVPSCEFQRAAFEIGIDRQHRAPPRASIEPPIDGCKRSRPGQLRTLLEQKSRHRLFRPYAAHPAVDDRHATTIIDPRNQRGLRGLGRALHPYSPWTLSYRSSRKEWTTRPKGPLRVGPLRGGICHPFSLAVAHLNLNLSRLSWSTDRQPISFMSRSISARRFSSALSTPA